MKNIKFYTGLFILLFLFISCIGKKQGNNTSITPEQSQNQKSVHDFVMKDIEGKEVPLKEFSGKVLLIVNVASQCGYTSQYSDLQKFYEEYKDKGVVVLGFPANNFGGQEPGTDQEIKQFCSSNYGVTFPMFSKISVTGEDQHPLYKYLTSTLNVQMKWNFNKFLIDKSGKPVQFFLSSVKPSDGKFQAELKKLL